MCDGLLSHGVSEIAEKVQTVFPRRLHVSDVNGNAERDGVYQTHVFRLLE